MTKALQNKIAQLTALLSSEEDRKKLAKQLQKDISALIDKQPDLPHKGDYIWCWHGHPAYYVQLLYRGQIEEVVWRHELQCFKVRIKCENGTLLFKPLDQVWRTQKEAEHWDLLRRIKAAEQNLKTAQRKLDELKQQLEEYT